MRNGIMLGLCLLLVAAASGDGLDGNSIADLRAAGPDGLNKLLAQYDQHPDANLLPEIDAVAGQRDAIYSRLYWYTDLPSAEAAARQQHKPILSLRLLGKLTDEYSCANSRFFRTVLYANARVSQVLRSQFILVWQSERPVPVVTIDYGDGRVLKRTITGNSVHYVLNADGQVYDALPGLFDPVTFCRVIEQAGQAIRSGQTPQQYWANADDAILRSFSADSATLQFYESLRSPKNAHAMQASGNPPDAARAMPLTLSKAAIETPLLREMSPRFADEMDRNIDAADAETWSRIAQLHASDSALDANSISLIRNQDLSRYQSDPAALDRTVRQFQQTIEGDSVRDNYQMRKRVLGWLRDGKAPTTVENLNSRVYAELFLTPANDPWLGLLPGDAYTALDGNGCCVASPTDASAPR